MQNFIFLLFTVVIGFSATSYANEAKVLSFSHWQKQQELEAKNAFARASNKLLIALQENKSKKETDELKKDMERAERAVESSKHYTIEDYLLVYLMSEDLQKAHEKGAILKAAAAQMSQDEVALMMGIWMQSLRPAAAGPATQRTTWAPELNSRASRTP